MIEIYFYRICQTCRHTNLNISAYVHSANDQGAEELVIDCECDWVDDVGYGICPWV